LSGTTIKSAGVFTVFGNILDLHEFGPKTPVFIDVLATETGCFLDTFEFFAIVCW
jgi:hypothetical protein